VFYLSFPRLKNWGAKAPRWKSAIIPVYGIPASQRRGGRYAPRAFFSPLRGIYRKGCLRDDQRKGEAPISGIDRAKPQIFHPEEEPGRPEEAKTGPVFLETESVPVYMRVMYGAIRRIASVNQVNYEYILTNRVVR